MTAPTRWPSSWLGNKRGEYTYWDTSDGHSLGDRCGNQTAPSSWVTGACTPVQGYDAPVRQMVHKAGRATAAYLSEVADRFR